MNRRRFSQLLVAPLHINWVDGRVKTAVRADEDIVAESHLCLVKHREIEVGKEMLAHLDVNAKVAIYRCVYVQALARSAKELGNALVALVDLTCGIWLISKISYCLRRRHFISSGALALYHSPLVIC